MSINSPKNTIHQALRELQVTGYTVLERALSPDLVGTLHSAFMVRLEENIQQIGANRGKQRQGGVALPIDRPFSDPEVLGNPLALDILSDLLDGDIVCSYFEHVRHTSARNPSISLSTETGSSCSQALP